MKYWILFSLLLVSCGMHGRGLSLEDRIEDAHIEGEDNTVYLQFLENDQWELTLNSYISFDKIFPLDSAKDKFDTAFVKQIQALFLEDYKSSVKEILTNQQWCVKTKHKDSTFTPVLEESLEGDGEYEAHFKISSKYQNCLQRGIRKLVGGAPKVAKDSLGVIRFYWKNPPISKTHKFVMNAGEFISSNSSYMKLGRAYWDNNPPTIKAVVKEGENNATRNTIIASSIATVGIVVLAFFVTVKAFFLLPLVLIGALLYSASSEPNREVDMESVLDTPKEQILDCLAPLSAFERSQKKRLKKSLELTSMTEDKLGQLNNSICEYNSENGSLTVRLVGDVSKCSKDTYWKVYFNDKGYPRWDTNVSKKCKREY